MPNKNPFKRKGRTTAALRSTSGFGNASATGASGYASPRVLYVSSFLSQPAYDRILSEAPYPPSQATQKYNALLTSGMVASGAQVTAISAPPISHTTSGRHFLQLPREQIDGVSFHYLPVISLPGIKHAITWLSAFFTTLRLCSKGTLVLCYGLVVSACGGARAAARLRGCPVGVIVSDLPEDLAHSQAMHAATQELTRYDGYVLLTEAMNPKVNPHGKPHCVVEGQADAALATRPNDPADKRPERVCLYAGMLHERYGILRLVEAFENVPFSDARLAIFGAGDALDAIKAAANRDSRIEYLGVADNATVVNAEFSATLLINPRPTDEDFTQYSFPSKNLEYMASGTPVLTTRLPGMPEEYHPYVYLFDGETPQDMAKTLTEILSLPASALMEKGAAAKAFVLEHKSNTAQAARIIRFLQGLA